MPLKKDLVKKETREKIDKKTQRKKRIVMGKLRVYREKFVAGENRKIIRNRKKREGNNSKSETIYFFLFRMFPV